MDKSSYFLGRSIIKQFAFQRVPIAQSAPVTPIKPQKDDSIINKKVLIVFGIVAVIKVSILLLWVI